MPRKANKQSAPKKHRKPHAAYAREFSEAVARLSGEKPHRRKEKTAKKKAKKKKKK